MKKLRIDPLRHLLQLPEEPFCVIQDAERRTAVSEIPHYEENNLDSTILKAIKTYSSPNSTVFKPFKSQYGGTFQDLPPSDAIPTALPALHYEPEIER